MTEAQITRAMDQVADELKILRKQIRSLKYKITRNKKSGSPVDIDETLSKLSDMNIQMAVLLRLALKWRQLAIDDGIEIND